MEKPEDHLARPPLGNGLFKGLEDPGTIFGMDTLTECVRVHGFFRIKTCQELAEGIKVLANEGDGFDDQKATSVSASLVTFEQALRKLEPSSPSQT